MENRARLVKAVVLILLMEMALATPPSHAYATDPNAKVKAVFLFKFVNYITWPANQGQKVNICTYNGDAFGGILEKINELKGEQMAITHLPKGSSAGACHIIYVNKGELPSVPGDSAVLTVSDHAGFSKEKGMIELAESAKNMKLIINLKRLQEAKLKASSRLLSIAEVIR